jgi:CubicO group peptidase (beta-lactamase class C family)
MTTPGLDQDRTAELDAALSTMVEREKQTGLAWLVARDGDVHVGTAGVLDPTRPGSAPVQRDTIFRISSMTKPVTAVAALMLVDEGILRLDAPVDDLLPELADRRVLADPEGSIDDTVPALRPITLHDVLTFRMGHGFDFSTEGPQPVVEAVAAAGVAVGPPRPQEQLPADEYLRALGSVPLAWQPGERWLYHTSSDVLGVLIERAVGEPLDRIFASRLFEPLGMTDTGFWVPEASLDRFGPCVTSPDAAGAREVFDPAEGQWSRRPPFLSGGAGLVSTVDDYAAFARMLLAGGTTASGDRLVSEQGVALMTTNHLTDHQLATAAPDPSGGSGWGYGVSVRVTADAVGRCAGAYGWDGGLGSSWANDPEAGLVGILLTNQMWTSPEPPAVCSAFWSGAYAARA